MKYPVVILPVYIYDDADNTLEPTEHFQMLDNGRFEEISRALILGDTDPARTPKSLPRFRWLHRMFFEETERVS